MIEDAIYRSTLKIRVTKQLFNLYAKYFAPCLSLEACQKEKIKDYGMVKADFISIDIVKIKGVVVKPDPSRLPGNFGITGIYAFNLMTMIIFRV